MTTVTSTDQEGDSVTYSITGGLDQDAFSLEPDTGALTFSTTPDFTNPADTDNNNIYTVHVTVTENNGAACLTDLRTINVTVARTQSFNLIAGWNQISLNVIPADASPRTVFSSFIAPTKNWNKLLAKSTF